MVSQPYHVVLLQSPGLTRCRYVLSPTHLHEFKSADRIYSQPPVMSLYLPDQKLGSHSQPGSSSHKFVLKGRQTGSMHRGHTWVFRAETYDTMLAWYEDVKNLTEKKGEERDAFVRRHVRSASRGSARSARSVSSDGALDEDEADQIPYASQSMSNEAAKEEPRQRPSPGGRFPSDIQLERNLQAPFPPSSGSSEIGHDLTTASGGLQEYTPYPTHSTNRDTTMPAQQHYDQGHPIDQGYSTDRGYPASPNGAAYQYNTEYAYAAAQQQQNFQSDQFHSSQYANPTSNYSQAVPAQAQPSTSYQPTNQQLPIPRQPDQGADRAPIERHNSEYGDWMAPAAGGAFAGGLATATYNQQQQYQNPEVQQQPPAASGISGAANTEADSTSNPIAMPANSNAGNTAQEIHAPQPIPLVEKSFLGSDEAAPAAASSNHANGGPVVHDKEVQTFPGMNKRQNTDISISDLHVPGEYPRPPKSEAQKVE